MILLIDVRSKEFRTYGMCTVIWIHSEYLNQISKSKNRNSQILKSQVLKPQIEKSQILKSKILSPDSGVLFTSWQILTKFLRWLWKMAMILTGEIKSIVCNIKPIYTNKEIQMLQNILAINWNQLPYVSSRLKDIMFSNSFIFETSEKNPCSSFFFSLCPWLSTWEPLF